ncbi:MAG: hypothetical protein WCJ29_03200 [bacterium]
MKLKSHKALTKRLTITKNKKVLKRRAGQDHFNTRDTGKASRNKRRDASFSSAFNKTLKNEIANF